MPEWRCYQLRHAHLLRGSVDHKTLGFYPSRSQVRAAAARAITRAGFRDHPAGFSVTDFVLDERPRTSQVVAPASEFLRRADAGEVSLESGSKVFVPWMWSLDREDGDAVGVYASEVALRRALGLASEFAGKHMTVSEYRLDEDLWADGFVTV